MGSVGAPMGERPSRTAARRHGGQGGEGQGPAAGRKGPAAQESGRDEDEAGEAKRQDDRGLRPATAPSAEGHAQDLGPSRAGEIEQERHEQREEGPDESGDDEEGAAQPRLGPQDPPEGKSARDERGSGGALEAEVGALGGHDGDGGQRPEEPELGGPEATAEEKGGQELESAAQDLRE